MALETSAVTRGLVVAISLLLVGGLAAAVTTDDEGDQLEVGGTTTTVAPGSAPAGGDGGAGDGGAAAPGGDGAASGSGGGAGSAGTPGGPTAPNPAATMTPPKDGTYTYRSEGGEDDGEENERTVRTTSKSEGEVRQDLGGQFEASSGNLEVVWKSDGWTWEGISAEGGGESGSCKFTPPLRYLPQPLTPGTTWSYDSTCEFTIGVQKATLHISGTGKVVGAERFTVGGTAVDVWKIERSGTFDVAAGVNKSSATSSATELWSPAHGLELRSTTTVQSDDGEYSQTRVLKSLKPQ